MVLMLGVTALYGQFLWNPLIFDDSPFFMAEGGGGQPIDAIPFSFLWPRSLPFASLAWTKALFGLELRPFRIGNLLLHGLCVCALFAWLRLMLTHAMQASRHASDADHKATCLALVGALVFALHPLGTYTVGYLVQRSMVMATLFSLLSLWCWAYGWHTARARWLWVGVVMYYFAVFSKEHAITILAVVPLMLWWLDADWKMHWKRGVLPGLAMVGVAMLILWAHRNLMGVTYEPEAKLMLTQVNARLPYLSSVVTQCMLYFKYWLLWLAPLPQWHSIDMREPFAAQLMLTDAWGVLAFGAWGGVGYWLLRQRGFTGLAGLGLLFPWVLFFTEFSTIRIHEPFVLYRSYLWMSGAALLIPVAICGVDKKLVALVLIPVLATLGVLGMERMATFSSPILLWEDAKKLVEGRPDAQGAERIYYNLGRHQMLNDMVGVAEHNLRQALAIQPDFVEVHGVLGALYRKTQQWPMAIDEYSQAIALEDKLQLRHQSVYLVGRAMAYEGAGDGERAVRDYLEACRIDVKVCESLRKSAQAKS